MNTWTFFLKMWSFPITFICTIMYARFQSHFALILAKFQKYQIWNLKTSKTFLSIGNILKLLLSRNAASIAFKAYPNSERSKVIFVYPNAHVLRYFFQEPPIIFYHETDQIDKKFWSVTDLPSTNEVCIVCVYEKVSDVPESRVWFASKNLTPCRMH